MPDFSKAFLDGKRARLPNGDVRWLMSGMGSGVTDAAALQPLWWVENAALPTEASVGLPVPFRGVRLALTIRDPSDTDALRLEVWMQTAVQGGGILLDRVDVAPVAGVQPGAYRDIGVWGAPLENLGIRARLTAGGTMRQVAGVATFFCQTLGQSGRLWLGEGVTAV